MRTGRDVEPGCEAQWKSISRTGQDLGGGRKGTKKTQGSQSALGGEDVLVRRAIVEEETVERPVWFSTLLFGRASSPYEIKLGDT